MKRHAYLLRYGAWQLLDYLYPAGMVTALIVSLITWVVVTQIHMVQQFQQTRPGSIGFPADLWAAQLPPVFYILAFLGTILAVHGIVSEGRRLGYYRFLFAKPLNPLAYHAQAFVVNGIGFVTLSAVLIAIFSMWIHPVWSWQFLSALALVYLTLGGIGFLISAVARGDGVVLMVVIAVSYSFWSSWEHAVGWRHWAVYALPPVARISGIVTLAFGATTEFPWSSVAWLAGYGLVCFVLGLVVLRFRSFGEA